MHMLNNNNAVKKQLGCRWGQGTKKIDKFKAVFEKITIILFTSTTLQMATYIATACRNKACSSWVDKYDIQFIVCA